MIGALPHRLQNCTLRVDKELDTVKEMTFLLFLASLAALEYVLRRNPSRPAPRNRFDEPRDIRATAGLHSLAQALEQHGRGKSVGQTEEKLAK